jgi:hypothetical protein
VSRAVKKELVSSTGGLLAKTRVMSKVLTVIGGKTSAFARPNFAKVEPKVKVWSDTGWSNIIVQRV